MVWDKGPKWFFCTWIFRCPSIVCWKLFLALNYLDPVVEKQLNANQFSLQSQRKAMPKNVQTIAQLHSSHMLAKKCSKFSKWGFNSMWTENFQMFKLDLKKQRTQRSNCQHSLDHRKIKSSRKTSALLATPKPFCKSQQTVESLKEMGIPDTLPASWETCMQVKKQQLESDMEQQTDSK